MLGIRDMQYESCLTGIWDPSMLEMMVTDDFLLLKILTIYAIGLSSAKFQQSTVQ